MFPRRKCRYKVERLEHEAHAVPAHLGQAGVVKPTDFELPNKSAARSRHIKACHAVH